MGSSLVPDSYNPNAWKTLQHNELLQWDIVSLYGGFNSLVKCFYMYTDSNQKVRLTCVVIIAARVMKPGDAGSYKSNVNAVRIDLNVTLFLMCNIGAGAVVVVVVVGLAVVEVVVLLVVEGVVAGAVVVVCVVSWAGVVGETNAEEVVVV